MRTLLVLGVVCIAAAQAGRLQVQGTNFVKDGHRVFLSGANLAWIHYAYEFGNHQYSKSKADYERIMKELHEAGGNSMRFWVHYEGESSPNFDSSGHVTGLDRDGTFISEFTDLLNAAAKYDVLVFPTFWNGATNHKDVHGRLVGLIQDTNKLQSYLDKALKPLVRAVGTMPALGGWDLMNEPEGIMQKGRHSGDPCFDTQHLQNSGMGWADSSIHYEEMLRFFNWQAAAIKEVDPRALVTVGQWNAHVVTDQYGDHNHYSDHCLIKAGGKSHGTLDFYEVHTYDWQGKFDPISPFLHSFGDYHLDKPMIIGEFRSSSGAGRSNEQMFEWAYDHGYSGAWTWQANESDKQNDNDSWVNQRKGMSQISNKNGAGGSTHISV